MASKYKNARKAGFRSGLEVWTKAELDKAGLEFCYECLKVQLLSPVSYPSMEKPSTGKKREFKLKERELGTTYTPDFVGPNWIIETKGMRTPEFNLKWKLFKHWLVREGKTHDLYMPTNQKEVLLTIKSIQKNG